MLLGVVKLSEKNVFATNQENKKVVLTAQLANFVMNMIGKTQQKSVTSMITIKPVPCEDCGSPLKNIGRKRKTMKCQHCSQKSNGRKCSGQVNKTYEEKKMRKQKRVNNLCQNQKIV